MGLASLQNEEEYRPPITLDRWLEEMLEANPIAHLSVKGVQNILKIQNGEPGHFVIFDNAGGLLFDVFDLKTQQAATKFIEAVGEGCVYGYASPKKKILSNHQKRRPHWSLEANFRANQKDRS